MEKMMENQNETNSVNFWSNNFYLTLKNLKFIMYFLILIVSRYETYAQSVQITNEEILEMEKNNVYPRNKINEGNSPSFFKTTNIKPYAPYKLHDLVYINHASSLPKVKIMKIVDATRNSTSTQDTSNLTEGKFCNIPSHTQIKIVNIKDNSLENKSNEALVVLERGRSNDPKDIIVDQCPIGAAFWLDITKISELEKLEKERIEENQRKTYNANFKKSEDLERKRIENAREILLKESLTQKPIKPQNWSLSESERSEATRLLENYTGSGLK